MHHKLTIHIVVIFLMICVKLNWPMIVWGCVIIAVCVHAGLVPHCVIFLHFKMMHFVFCCFSIWYWKRGTRAVAGLLNCMRWATCDLWLPHKQTANDKQALLMYLCYHYTACLLTAAFGNTTSLTLCSSKAFVFCPVFFNKSESLRNL